LIIMVGLATRAEPITERAAQMSGARAITVLRTITLPLLAPDDRDPQRSLSLC
jgi:ABC-type Fe3+ transport system permease subunit